MIHDLTGIPFKNGGRSIEEGFDCWGLACEVYKRFGIELPDYRIDANNREAILNQYQNVVSHYSEVSGVLPVPCLVFMRINSVHGNHVGVYLGAGQFIHARSKIKSCIERLDSPFWRWNIIGFYVPKEVE